MPNCQEWLEKIIRIAYQIEADIRRSVNLTLKFTNDILEEKKYNKYFK